MCSVDCYFSVSPTVLHVFCSPFLTLVFCMCFIDGLLRKCLAHCFVCVLLTVSHVRASRTVLDVFC